jgi:hypothetical protein
MNPGLIPGNATIVGNIELVGGGSIVTTGNGNLVLLPNGSGITVVGDAGATSRSLNLNDDLFVTGRLEVDGAVYCDTYLYTNLLFCSPIYGVRVDDSWLFKASIDDGGMIALFGDGKANNNLILTTQANSSKDHDHDTPSANPTLFFHSATDPDTNNLQYLYQRHNAVDAEIGTGLGGIIMAPASGSLWKTNQTYPTGKNYAEKMIHQIIPLATDSDTTAVGVTPNGPVTGYAVRVSTAIAGLDNADHSISLGVAGTTAKYGTVANGAAATSIAVNKKFHGQGLAAGWAPEPLALILTLSGGGDNTPTAGAVEIEIHFIEQSALADV